MRRISPAIAAALALTLPALSSAQLPQPEWEQVEEETLTHFRALLQFDTSDPPGRELPAAEYLRDVLEAEGIAVELLATDPARPNVVARLEGTGEQEPLLIMAHTGLARLARFSGELGLVLYSGLVFQGS